MGCVQSGNHSHLFKRHASDAVTTQTGGNSPVFSRCESDSKNAAYFTLGDESPTVLGEFPCTGPRWRSPTIDYAAACMRTNSPSARDRYPSDASRTFPIDFGSPALPHAPIQSHVIYPLFARPMDVDRSLSSPCSKSRTFSILQRSVSAPEDDGQIIHGLTEDNKHLYAEALSTIQETPDWQCAYENSIGPLKGKVLYKMEPGNKVGWIYLATIIPAPLVGVIAPMLEVETWTKWNPICTKHVRQGHCDAWKVQSYYAQSMALGAFKSEQNTRTHRWVNETHGFFLQKVTSLQPGEDGYVAPTRMNRDKVECVVLTASPSPEETLILQKIRVETPVTIPNFVQKIAFSILAPQMLKQFQTNAQQVADPRQPYQALIQADSYGCYESLHNLARADAAKPISIIDSVRAFLHGDNANLTQDQKARGKLMKKEERERKKEEKKEEKERKEKEKKEKRTAWGRKTIERQY